MNDDLVTRWNDVVSSEDEVWILGDLCMGKLDVSLTYVSLLNGIKHLLPGNHDRMFKCEGTKYANAAQRYLDAGITDVLESEVLLGLEKDRVAALAAHFPYQGDSRDGHEDRYQECRPKDKGWYLVHGHTHGLWRRSGRMIDVGVDAWAGYPVSFEDVAELFLSSEVNAEPLEWVA
jgi:calcineurin-like phosphoesterase family protein